MENGTKNTELEQRKHAGQEPEEFRFTQDLLPDVHDEELKAYHQRAWEAYKALPFPGPRDEPWRRTDIRELHTREFSLSLTDEGAHQPPDRFLSLDISGEGFAGQVVCGAGKSVCSLDSSLQDKGVIFTDFKTAEVEHPALINEIIGKVVSPEEDKFTALAAALGEDGVFLYVPKNVVIPQPLHSLYWGAEGRNAFINHLLIWVEDGAEVTFVHESASLEGALDSQLFHNGIVEIHVGRNAHLSFVEFQSWGRDVWSFTRERAQVMSDGNLEWIFGAMGTHLTKNFSDIDLMEPGATVRMSGFYFTDGVQHLDHDTQQNHFAPNTTSDLLYKGALTDHSRSVWQGMIYVAPGAFGTDGYQANRNLILSKHARADSIPGLEILADDVRCTHGATVGKVDPDLLFYLQSRGIPEKDAEQLIVMGFFAPIMERIPFEGVRERFVGAIREKMEGGQPS